MTVWLLTIGSGLVLVASCGDKDQVEECEELKGDSCTEHGLAEEQRSAMCDSCEQLWACYQD